MTDDQPTLGEVLRTVRRMEDSLKEVTGDHEQRIRKVERWMYAVPPTIVLAIASVIAAVGAP